MATAHDAAKAVIAYLKSLDDARDISVEQVQPDKKNNEWTVYISLARSPIEPRSWKRFHLQEGFGGNLEVKAMFDWADEWTGAKSEFEILLWRFGMMKLPIASGSTLAR